jgi:hypothetical protein
MNITADFLDSQRQMCDPEADTLVAEVISSGRLKDLYAAFSLPFEKGKRSRSKNDISIFLNSARVQPDWYESRRVLRGQEVFKRYALDIMTLLGAMSLPYCYAASPGNKALYLAGKMRNDTGKRLMDTANFVMTVLTPGNLEERGEGYFHIRKTRLIHALVRHHLTRGAWQQEWGAPINQEDMAGTNLAFSYIILNGLQQSGFSLSPKEKEDFLYVWRLIGYHLNIDERLLPASLPEARVQEQIIHRRHFKKSEEGQQLTQELVAYFKTTFPPMPAYFIDSQIRYFLGPEISAYLGMKPEPLKDRVRIYLSAIREAMNLLMVNPQGMAKLQAQTQSISKRG